MNKYTCSQTGQQITLTEQIASSGEGKVWRTNRQDYLAKIYHDPHNERVKKLDIMVKHAPIDPNVHKQHISFAWPKSLLKDGDDVMGFLMPEIRDSEELLKICNPRLRKRLGLEINWYFLHVTARNVAAIIQKIHYEGYVLGDIKLQNILVNRRALPSIIDVDSFQVKDPKTREIYHCLVGSEGFTPVELLGKDISSIEQTEVQDRFRLGVIIYHLLFGNHPFQGEWTGTGEPPELNELIRQGFWPYAANSLIQPGNRTIPIEVVHPVLQRCFLNCFNGGHDNPYLRPTASDWVEALEIAFNELSLCGILDSHHYSLSYGKCYWCERATVLGVDILPGNKLNKPRQSPPQVQPQYRQEKIETINSSTRNQSAVLSKESGTQIGCILYSSSPGLNQKTVAYRTISEAIKNAEPNSQIIVKPGLYNESLIIDKPIKIIGDGTRDKIIIESTESSCLIMQTDSAVVQCMTLRCKAGTKNKEYFGIDIPQGQLILDNCEITSDSLACIGIYGMKANPLIRNCKIYDGKQCGIFVYQNGKGTVENCKIYGNHNSGVVIKEEGNPLILNCKIFDGKQCGVFVYQNGKGIVDNCEIYGNEHSGVQIREEGNPVIRNCKIHHGKQCGVFVYQNGKGIVDNCEIYGNEYSGVQISEEGNPLIRKCKIYDGKADGVFVIKKGKGTVKNCEIYGNEYSGVQISEEGNPLIRKCKIYDGKADGVFVIKKGKGTVKNCEIYGNEYSGVQISEEGNPLIRKCKIYDGKHCGVFVIKKGKGTVENCEIYGNEYSGVKIGEQGNLFIRNCRINKNTYQGILINKGGVGTIVNCDLRGNKYGSWNIDYTSEKLVIRQNNITD